MNLTVIDIAERTGLAVRDIRQQLVKYRATPAHIDAMGRAWFREEDVIKALNEEGVRLTGAVKIVGPVEVVSLTPPRFRGRPVCVA